MECKRSIIYLPWKICYFSCDLQQIYFWKFDTFLFEFRIIFTYYKHWLIVTQSWIIGLLFSFGSLTPGVTRSVYQFDHYWIQRRTEFIVFILVLLSWQRCSLNKDSFWRTTPLSFMISKSPCIDMHNPRQVRFQMPIKSSCWRIATLCSTVRYYYCWNINSFWIWCNVGTGTTDLDGWGLLKKDLEDFSG